MHGLAVTTIEGLGSTTRGLHAVQERLAKSHGSQCGFCTPGIIMSMYALLRETANKKKKHEARPGFRDMEIALQGKFYFYFSSSGDYKKYIFGENSHSNFKIVYFHFVFKK